MTYQIGQPFEAKYDNAPIQPDRQYQIDQEVCISDTETGVLLAKFLVKSTDEYNVSGIISAVFNIDGVLA